MKTSLQKIFDKFAEEADLVINQTDSAGTKWQVTRAAVLQKDGKGKETKPKVVKGKLNKPFNIAIMYPENLIVNSCDVTKEELALVLNNKIVITEKEVHIVSNLQDGKSILYLNFPEGSFNNRVIAIQKHLQNLELKNCSCRFCCTKQKTPMLEISEGNETLRVALTQGTKPEKVTFSFLDKQISLLDWDDATKSYKTIKEIQMFEPPALPKLNKKTKTEDITDVPMLEGLEDITQDIAEDVSNSLLAAAGVTPAPVKEPEVSAIIEEAKVDYDKVKARAPETDKRNNKAKAAEAEKDSSVEVPKVTENKDPEVTELKDENKEAQEVATKKSRTPRLKKKMQDLSNIIEALRTDPPDTMTVEEGLNEIRQLRELIKMASCRLANVATLTIDGMNSKASKAIEAQKKLEEISCLLSPKK